MNHHHSNCIPKQVEESAFDIADGGIIESEKTTPTYSSGVVFSDSNLLPSALSKVQFFNLLGYSYFTCQEVGSSIPDLDLVLFDLDGLLVDSEVFHWQAYQQMVERLGCRLAWDYLTFLQIAGSSSHGVREGLKKEFPDLFERYTWDEMYAIKKEKLEGLLDAHPVPLMPGAERFLTELAKEHKQLVVVTHSPLRFVEQVRASHKILSAIGLWVYREMYTNPKPAPDCYATACAACKVSPERAVGFEDSWRGIEALRAAGCRPVLVNGRDKELRHMCQELSIPALSSFDEVLLRRA